jgi:hypothetical protein
MMPFADRGTDSIILRVTSRRPACLHRSRRARHASYFSKLLIVPQGQVD